TTTGAPTTRPMRPASSSSMRCACALRPTCENANSSEGCPALRGRSPRNALCASGRTGLPSSPSSLLVRKDPSMSQFDNVSVVKKANVYFDGKCVSHTVIFPDGSKKTIGLIFPSTLTFNTGAPEVMELNAGACRVRLKGESG